MTYAGRKGFTVVELLVAFAIVGTLLSLLLPAVQQAREAARRVGCRNRLHQLGVAVANYQAALRVYPPTYCVDRDRLAAGDGSWSAFGRLLPYLEESAADRIRLDLDWHEQVATGLTGRGVGVLQCPSDPSTHSRTRGGGAYVAPVTYGFVAGSWLVFDPVTGRTGDGAFGVNASRHPGRIPGGLSKTLCLAEVKAYTPYVRNADSWPSEAPDDPSVFEGVAGQLKLGGADRNTGHTVWPDGRVHHTGVTTTFPPGTAVRYLHDGVVHDIDFTSQQEGRSADRPTCAAVTARSHHAGLVHALMLDGSVRPVAHAIAPDLWRRMGTRAAD